MYHLFDAGALATTIKIMILPAVLMILWYVYDTNPYDYPECLFEFNISKSGANVRMQDVIKDFVSNDANWDEIERHQAYIRKWIRKETKEAQVKNKLKLFRKRRLHQLRTEVAEHQTDAYTFTLYKKKKMRLKLLGVTKLIREDVQTIHCSYAYLARVRQSVRQAYAYSTPAVQYAGAGQATQPAVMFRPVQSNNVQQTVSTSLEELFRQQGGLD